MFLLLLFVIVIVLTGFHDIHLQHSCLQRAARHAPIVNDAHAAIELVHHIEYDEANDQHQQRHERVGQHQRRVRYGIQHYVEIVSKTRNNF